MANGNGNGEKTDGWMNDVQKTLAYFVTVAFVLLIFLWVFFPPKMSPESMAQLNQMVTTLQTLLVGAFGFFLGSSMSSKDKDASQNRVLEKLTSTNPPGAPGPVAPVPAPPVVVVTAWWGLLKDDERAAIAGAAQNDPKVAAFMTAAQTGKAAPDDLTDLVAKGLLTQERADVIKAV